MAAGAPPAPREPPAGAEKGVVEVGVKVEEAVPRLESHLGLPQEGGAAQNRPARHADRTRSVTSTRKVTVAMDPSASLLTLDTRLGTLPGTVRRVTPHAAIPRGRTATKAETPRAEREPEGR